MTTRKKAAPAAAPASRPWYQTLAQLILFVAALIGGAQASNRGWLTELVPPPAVAEPIGIKAFGPAETLAGGEYYFVCETTGEAGEPVWEISPRVVGTLTVLPGKRAARFQSNEPGKHVLTVSVAGAAKQVATEHIEFVNLLSEEVDEEEPADAPPSVSPPAPHVAPVVPSADPPLTAVAVLIEQALEDVPSPDRAAEAKRIKGIVEQLIGRIKSGLVAPEVDVTLDLEEQIETALGEKARNWGLFVADIRQTFAELKQEGHATTAADAVPFLETIAIVLGKAH
jgi:hypothetical protein